MAGKRRSRNGDSTPPCSRLTISWPKRSSTTRRGRCRTRTEKPSCLSGERLLHRLHQFLNRLRNHQQHSRRSRLLCRFDNLHLLLAPVGRSRRAALHGIERGQSGASDGAQVLRHRDGVLQQPGSLHDGLELGVVCAPQQQPFADLVAALAVCRKRSTSTRKCRATRLSGWQVSTSLVSGVCCVLCWSDSRLYSFTGSTTSASTRTGVIGPPAA